jgi:5-methylcytosine-specific restriction protein A
MCKQLGNINAASIADHDPPHKGDENIFWNGRLRSLCKHCHDSHKQSEERTGKRKPAIGLDGWPLGT